MEVIRMNTFHIEVTRDMAAALERQQNWNADSRNENGVGK